MTEKNESDSLERMVEERLDSIFGQDQSEEPGSSEAGSLLEKVAASVQGLGSGITTDALLRLKGDIGKLGQSHGKDPFFQPLLKISSMLVSYLESNQDPPHPEAITLLRSVTRCMRTLDTSEGLTEERKRALVSSEIQSFKRFKGRVQGGRRSPQDFPASPESAATKEDLAGLRRDLTAVADKAASLENLFAKAVKDLGSRLETGISSLHQSLESIPEELRRETAAIKEQVERMQEAVSSGSASEELRALQEEVSSLREELKGVLEPSPESGDAGASPRELYVFHTGGIGYAVDAKWVVKACKAGSSLKKARKRGWLALSDLKPLFRSERKGLSPVGLEMDRDELRSARFLLVTGDQLEGADRTKGGGVLFLAAGDSRLLIFSDRPPFKELLGPEQEPDEARDRTAPYVFSRREEGKKFRLIDPLDLIDLLPLDTGTGS